MITFNTQEDFENAVMEVIRKRMMLAMYKDSWDDLVIVTSLIDTKDHNTITSDYVYKD